jgi:hypothetical protein
MKRSHLLLLLIVLLFVIGLILYGPLRHRGFATPADCIDAYRDASIEGNESRYLSCLAEPLRSETRRRYSESGTLADSLRDSMRDVKNWVLAAEPAIEGTTAHVDVDETRATGKRRTRFILERSGQGWLIVRIDPPQDIPMDIPYGTHISKVPEETKQTKEP